MYRDNGKPTSVRNLSHAELAMRAARAMRRARQKEKTGHVVCHHLLRMLESGDEPVSAANGTSVSARGEAYRRQRDEARQYSLGL